MKEFIYRNELSNLLKDVFLPAGYELTSDVELDIVPENSKYSAFNFSLNNQRIIFRKAKVTPDRPGAFVTVWQRPESPIDNNNKPIPLKSTQLDYLFVRVQKHGEAVKKRDGFFVFPVSVLIKKSIVTLENGKGKTGFRVFPAWSADRGTNGMKVFSDSGKKSQAWQLPYFVEIDKNNFVDKDLLNNIFNGSDF